MTSDLAPLDVDPDPFGIGIALFAAMVSGVSFLETRRQTQLLQHQQRAAYRAAWFEARRSVIFFKRSVDEFETYVLEDGYARRAFRVGAVRLVVSPRRAHELKRLRGQSLTTAHRLGDNLDELSNFLGAEDQAAVTAILSSVAELGVFPDRYADLVTQARAIMSLYRDLLDDIAEREAFEDDTPSFTSG
jgi:hypothetical protein